MKQRSGGLRRHLTYANVISTLALFLVVAGGSAFAASGMLAKNSVNSRTVKNGTLTSADLKDGRGVRGVDVADGSLTGADVADGSIASADIADGTVGNGDLADNSVDSAKVQDGSLKGGDVADNSLTGKDIDESTLGTVPSAVNAQTLSGRPFTSFVGSSIYKRESAVAEGTPFVEGALTTYTASQACDPGDVLLAGGPANVKGTSDIVESFPSPGSTNSWSVRINKNGETDNWNVVVLCATLATL